MYFSQVVVSASCFLTVRVLDPRADQAVRLQPIFRRLFLLPEIYMKSTSTRAFLAGGCCLFERSRS